MAEEALALHIAGMEEDGEDIPEPLSLEDLMATMVQLRSLEIHT